MKYYSAILGLFILMMVASSTAMFTCDADFEYKTICETKCYCQPSGILTCVAERGSRISYQNQCINSGRCRCPVAGGSPRAGSPRAGSPRAGSPRAGSPRAGAPAPQRPSPPRAGSPRSAARKPAARRPGARA